MARQGRARLGKAGMAGQGAAWRGRAGCPARSPKGVSLMLENECVISARTQHQPGPVHMYNLRQDQLDEIASPREPFTVGISTTLLGIFVGFLTTILTVDMPDRTFALFVALAFASAVLCVFTGFFAVRHFREVRATIRAIKVAERHGGTMSGG